MKKLLAILSLVLAMTLVAGVMVGCNNTENNSTTAPSTTAPTDPTDPTDPAEVEDIIGKIAAIGDSFLNLQVFTSAAEIQDYIHLDITTLTETQETDYAFTESKAEYVFIAAGQQKVAKRDNLKVGDTVVITVNAEGKQVVYVYTDVLPEDEPEATEPSGPSTDVTEPSGPSTDVTEPSGPSTNVTEPSNGAIA